MSTTQRHRIAVALSERIGREASAERVATATLEFWREIAAALVPVIGERGVGALRERALFLAARTHGWLGARDPGSASMPTVEAFHAALVTQSALESMAGAAAFFEAFHDLLAGMIGADLTARLLRLTDDPQAGGTTARVIA